MPVMCRSCLMTRRSSLGGTSSAAGSVALSRRCSSAAPSTADGSMVAVMDGGPEEDGGLRITEDSIARGGPAGGWVASASPRRRNEGGGHPRLSHLPRGAGRRSLGWSSAPVYDEDT